MESGEVGSAIVEWDYGLEEPMSPFHQMGMTHMVDHENFDGQEQLNHSDDG